MELIDLHTHSACSDGSLSPAALVQLAKDSGLKAIALTDHDTVEGVDEALRAGCAAGIEVVPGIEISASLDKISMHILGYWIRSEDSVFRARIERLQEARDVRNQEIIHRLCRLGFPVSMAELQKYSASGPTGRPHIARMLVDLAVVENMQQAFARYLRKGRPAYADRFRYTAQEAISIIHEAGGLCVLAHPGTIRSARKGVWARLLNRLKALGLDGLEVYYPDHDPAMLKRLNELAGRLGLLVTGGSDFHGAYRPDVSLGNLSGAFVIPYELLATMKAAHQAR